MAKNILGIFLEKLLEFPLWVKQIIYLYLHENLVLYLSENFIQTNPENIFQLNIPQISFAGKTELMERKKNLEPNVYIFLENVSEELNIIEITMNNFWTMEEVAKYYMHCLENDYIKAPDSIYITAMAGFMSGEYRTGEYFKRIEKINVDQLEKTIIKQKEYAQKGVPKKMAEIMIDLGYITQKDTFSLIKIKEESKRRFILDSSILPKESAENINNASSYTNEIVKLKEQNKLLKEQLNKILTFIKKK